MMIYVQLGMNILIGFVAHLLKPVTTGHIRKDWNNICNYALGSLYVFPMIIMGMRILKRDIEKVELRFTVSYWLSFLTMGIGVVIGYWYAPDEEN